MKKVRFLKKLGSLALASAVAAGCIAAPMTSSAAEVQAAADTSSKVIAFPGAEGGGMYTSGARGAFDAGENIEVYHVTNLNDSGEGSFRDAVSKGNRIVVFDVSGYIDLKTQLSIGHDNMTILGQTAPGDGICFRGNSIKINGKNVIIRYLRFRVGSKLADGSNTLVQDGFGMPIGTERVIMDHCSISWGTDENLSTIAVKDVTVQWSIVSEALNSSIHDKGEHSYAGIWGGVNLTYHHNLIANHKSRNPKIGTSETVSMTPGYTDDKTVVDIRNNVFYNWGDKAGYGAENGANVNIVNNYYKAGPATGNEYEKDANGNIKTDAGGNKLVKSTPTKRSRIFELSPGNKYQKNWSGAVYASGNYIDDDSTDPTEMQYVQAVNEENWQIEKGTGVYLDARNPSYEKLATPNETYLKDYPVSTETAKEAYDKVIDDAGAKLPKRDAVDTRVINNVINRTGTGDGTHGSYNLLDDPLDGIPEGHESEYDFRGYPIWTSESRAADYDADKDGVADEWEDKMGLDKTNPNDSLNIGPGGYTWLEIFAQQGISYTSSGDITLSSSAADYVSPSDDVSFTISGADGKTAELYSGAEKIGDVLSGSLSAKLKEGVNTVCAKIINPDGSYTYSNAVNVFVKGAAQPDETVSGDFDVVAEIEDVPSIAKNTFKGIHVDKYVIQCGYNDDYKRVIRYGKTDNPTLSENDDKGYKYLKISVRGEHIDLYCAKTLAKWEKLSENGYEYKLASAQAGVYETVPAGVKYVALVPFTVIKNQTSPTVEIKNIENNQRIGYNTELELSVKADTSRVSQISVLFNDEEIVSQTVDIAPNTTGTVKIPLSFATATQGTLTVVCIDDNYGDGAQTIGVSVSGDLTPWQMADIGMGGSDAKMYSMVTPDYTYKLSTGSGQIGGTSDKFGYMYQKFTEDMRLYARLRVQGGSQLGFVLRDSLDADSAAYYVGCDMTGGERVYSVKARTQKGGEMQTLNVFENIKEDKAFLIAEKAGSKLNVYQTEAGSTVYQTKTLLGSFDITGIGDEYYMGFGAVAGSGNAPDAGWIAIDGMDNNNEQSHIWNLNYGLDWSWQMQESNVLAPEWTAEDIGGNSSGKMKLTTGDDYSSERYVFREYTMDDSCDPLMSAKVYLKNAQSALNVYLQTGSSNNAYRIMFAEDGKIYSDNTATEPLGEWSPEEWYTVGMKQSINTDTLKTECTLNIWDKSGKAVVSDKAIEYADFFRTQINTEKKTPVTKAVYFEPVSGLTGEYYIDDVSVIGEQSSVIINKTEKWYKFDNAEAYEGMTLTGVTPDILTKSKTVDGESFMSKVRPDKLSKSLKFNVPAGSEVKIYAVSANKSEQRALVIDGNDVLFNSSGAVETGGAYAFDVSEAHDVVISAKAGVDIYGIKVTTTSIEIKDKKTTIDLYDPQGGTAQVTFAQDEAASSARLWIASYDGDLLVDESYKDVEVKPGETVSVEFDGVKQGSSYKAMLWDENQRPLCSAK